MRPGDKDLLRPLMEQILAHATPPSSGGAGDLAGSSAFPASGLAPGFVAPGGGAAATLSPSGDPTDSAGGEPGGGGRVLLLCGGQSPEHAVSLASGRCCAHALDRRRWTVDVACILTDGTWLFPKFGLGPKVTSGQIDKLFDIMELPDYAPKGYVHQWSVGMAMEYMLGDGRPDVILPVTHGLRGEDGTLQGLLEFLGIPYVGSGVLASALAMDKVRALEMMEAHGIQTARRIVVGPGRLPWNPEQISRIVEDRLGWPVFVKPSNGGSSLATACATTPLELVESVERAQAIDQTVLIEERILGADVTCGVVEIAGSGGGDEAVDAPPTGAGGETSGSGETASGRIHRLICPPTLIRPLKSGFFDYDAKYRPGASEEITPAPLDRDLLKAVQEIADRAHVILGCAGLSRTDVLVTESGEAVYLETNTLPGMTVTSLLPQGARAVGLDLTQLLSALVDSCLARVSANRGSFRGMCVSG